VHSPSEAQPDAEDIAGSIRSTPDAGIRGLMASGRKLHWNRAPAQKFCSRAIVFSIDRGKVERIR